MLGVTVMQQALSFGVLISVVMSRLMHIVL